MAQGVTARLENPPGLSGATWPTINTGVTVARHARYYYSQIRPGTYRTGLISPKHLDQRPFWTALSDRGKRVVIVDVPKTYPETGLNGIQVVDWGNHDGDILEGFLTYPPALAARIDTEFGPDPFGRRAFGVRGPSDLSAFVDGLCVNVERKKRLIESLMREQDWDLLFAVWDDAHWAGHFGWRLHDPDHPHYDAALAAAIGDPLERVLNAADRCLGELLDQVGPDVHVVLMSSHGMGPGYRTCEMLDPILRRLEGRPTTARGAAYSSLRRVWDSLPGGVHRPLITLKDLVRENLLATDRANRPWFALPSNNDGGSVRLNVAGREPQGRIQRGADYERTCQWLIDELKSVVDLDTGEKIVGEVYRPQALFSGDRVDELPDLAVEWLPGAPARRIGSERIGELEVTVSPYRSGEHLPDGLVISVLPGAKQGVGGVSLRAQDFAPTIAYGLGVELPGVDGVPVKAVLGEA